MTFAPHHLIRLACQQLCSKLKRDTMLREKAEASTEEFKRINKELRLQITKLEGEVKRVAGRAGWVAFCLPGIVWQTSHSLTRTATVRPLFFQQASCSHG